jgi:hypothetical protein
MTQHEPMTFTADVYMRAVVEQLGLLEPLLAQAEYELRQEVAAVTHQHGGDVTFAAICAELGQPRIHARQLRRRFIGRFRTARSAGRAKHAHRLFAIAALAFIGSFVWMFFYAYCFGYHQPLERTTIGEAIGAQISGLRHGDPLAIVGISLLLIGAQFLYLAWRCERTERRSLPRVKEARPRVRTVPIDKYLHQLSHRLETGWFHRRRILPEIRDHLQALETALGKSFTNVSDIEASFGNIDQLAASIRQSLRASAEHANIALSREQAPWLAICGGCVLAGFATAISFGRPNIARSEGRAAMWNALSTVWSGAMHGQPLCIVWLALALGGFALLILALIARLRPETPPPKRHFIPMR